MPAAVDLVIPVLNERQALPWVLSRIPPGVRAVVVDNNSTDGSGGLAAELGATVIHEPIPGFGSACWAGLQASDAPLVAFMDGDGSLDPSQLSSVTGPVADGRLDLVLGARRAAAGSLRMHHRFANSVLAFELRRRTGARITDLGPMRCCGREALLQLAMQDRRSGWPLEMVLRAHTAGWRIGEVPVDYLPRKGGRSKVTGTLKGTLIAVKDMGGLLRG